MCLVLYFFRVYVVQTAGHQFNKTTDKFRGVKFSLGYLESPHGMHPNKYKHAYIVGLVVCQNRH